LYPTPAAFLPADTAICAYGSIQLSPVRNYNSYRWNTGINSAQLTVSQPGTYWLEVTDANNCTGRDSVIVNPKDCLKGLYVPSGFTPNNDGKNDLLKPFLFGNIKKYEFRVFNRWGETVFVTKDPNAGWNGLHKGIPQDAAVFIWSCRYQLEGEEERVEKGTVVVVR
jgi:gliding motility-associated-like protein